MDGRPSKVASSSNGRAVPNSYRRRPPMTKVLSAVIILVILSASVSAQEAKPSVELRLEYLMTIDATLGPGMRVGQRAIVNVPGGSIRGPSVKGEIVAPAG